LRFSSRQQISTAKLSSANAAAAEDSDIGVKNVHVRNKDLGTFTSKRVKLSSDSFASLDLPDLFFSQTIFVQKMRERHARKRRAALYREVYKQ
jgi:hypothetical protein